MKELEEIEKCYKQSSLICLICNKNNISIKQKNAKLKKVINDKNNTLDLSEFIKKCNCGNNNNTYVHKYCLLFNILFNFEIKCEKCNTIYNIKINKRTNKRKILLIIFKYIIIYIIHLFIYLFCMFLLFINIILKDYILIIFRHLCYFFGIIIFVINSILLYFSIINNINSAQNGIYNYSINIYEVTKKKVNINESEFYKLIIEFYQWFHGKSPEDLLMNMKNNNMIKKEYNLYNNSIGDFINKNNIEIAQIKENKKNSKKGIDLKKEEKEKEFKNENENYNTNDIILIGFDKNDNNNINLKNILNLNDNKKNKQQEYNDIYSNQTNKEDLKIQKLFNTNFNDINYNNINNNSNSNNFQIKGMPSYNNESRNIIEDNLKKQYQDYINININPKTSKNIKINIHFTKDNQMDFSSSKENNNQFNKGKIGKTALIPKNLMMSNIISEANSIKRKRRQIKSIKIRQNKINLKGTNLPGGSIREDEEIDFSEFDKIGTKISRDNKKSIFLTKGDFSELKYSNFRSKKSFKDIDLNISNSDIIGMESNMGEQNVRNSVKNNMNGKHVHFAD